MKLNHIKVPNHLITDDSLSYSARKLGAVLYSRRNHFGTVKMSLKVMAGLSGLSISTVRKSLSELEASKHLTKCRQYKYDKQKGRFVYSINSYSLDLSFEGGFTFIPRANIRKAATTGASEFTVCLYLFFQTGNSNRAFPSLSKISDDLKMARSTVCRVMKALRTIGIFLIQRCLKANKAFSQNSYFFIHNSELQPVYVTQASQAAECITNDHLKPPTIKSCVRLSERVISFPPVNIIRRVFKKINTIFDLKVVRKLVN